MLTFETNTQTQIQQHAHAHELGTLTHVQIQ